MFFCGFNKPYAAVYVNVPILLCEYPLFNTVLHFKNLHWREGTAQAIGLNTFGPCWSPSSVL